LGDKKKKFVKEKERRESVVGRKNFTIVLSTSIINDNNVIAI